MRTIYRAVRYVRRRVSAFLSTAYSRMLFSLNGVECGSAFRSKGVPMVDIAKRGTMKVGTGLRLNNGQRHNMIGRQHRCSFLVTSTGSIVIGNNVGISASAFVSAAGISVGNNVKIGGNTVIYDTDFHSLRSTDRLNEASDRQHVKTAPVVIADNVFIGAHCTILKGVSIGENAVIGACSVVTTNVPANEIWAGNPAKFVRVV
jgi:acetyltransferase-like isoleucine patch superfamily enzyme